MNSKSRNLSRTWIYGLILSVLLSSSVQPYSLPMRAGSLGRPNQAGPMIVLVKIPAFGSSELLEGRVLNVNPADYKIAAFVFIESLGWFCKPTIAEPYTQLQQPDASFKVNLVTGGVDGTASRIALFVVPSFYSLPCIQGEATLPISLYILSRDRLIIDRDNPKQRSLSFSGIEFLTKENSVPLCPCPGPMLYSSSVDNVWVDSQGLHLRLKKKNGLWNGVEIYTKNFVVPGIYSLILASDVSGFAAKRGPVFGFFSYVDGGSEIDVEYGDLENNDGKNGQVLVQPPTPQNIQRFLMPAINSSVSQFNWQQSGRVDFKILRGADPNNTDPSVVITQFTPAQLAVVSGNERLRLNLWLFKNTPPNDGQEVEVVIKEIRYQPTVPVNLSAANYRNSPGLAEDSIVACFGAKLSATTAVATTLPLPTTLANRRVKIRDSANQEYNAPLFFVSPNQINYLLPAGIATDLATATVVDEAGSTVASATVQIVRTAPALFSANASGRGPAAAVLLRVKPDGTQIYEPVSRCDSAGSCTPIPIDLMSSDQAFLLLFGTGIRGRQNLSTVAAQLGEFSQSGRSLEVLYAGPQSDFAGLDQVTLRLPAGLSGIGEVPVALRVDALIANPVTINIR